MGCGCELGARIGYVTLVSPPENAPEISAPVEKEQRRPVSMT